MLNLGDPVELEGLTLFRDDEDVRKFYLLPDQPRVSRTDAGPEFLFIKYVDDRPGIADEDEKHGGYVQFRCDLVVDDDRRQRVLADLETRLTEEKARGFEPFGKKIGSTKPLLAAPPWVDGTVRLSSFEVSDDGAIRSVGGSARPNLVGDLSSSFTMQLDQMGAAIFADSFDTGAVPIVISYELRYKARVPASKLVIHAERETVRKTVWAAARPYAFVPAIKKYKAVPVTGPFSMMAFLAMKAASVVPMKALLMQRKVVEEVKNSIDVKILFGEGGDAESDASIREALLTMASGILTDQVLPQFFQSGEILGSAVAGGDIDDAEALLELKEEVDASLVPFHFELTEEIAVERGANPSAPLRMLLNADERAAAFREIGLMDSFFNQLDITATTSGVDFERDGISLIKVELEYEQTDVPTGDVRRHNPNDGARLLRASDEQAEWQIEFLARDADNLSITDYRLRTEVHYSEDIPPTISDWIPYDDGQAIIEPAALGALRLNLIFTGRSETVSEARVALKHTARSGDVFEAIRVLRPADTQDPAGAPDRASDRVSWFQFTGDFDTELRNPSYDYQVTWKLAGGGTIEGPWQSNDSDSVEIPSPFDDTLLFTLRPDGASDGVADISGEIRYEDTVRGYSVLETFTLDDTHTSVEIAIPVLADGPMTATLSGRLNRDDGSHELLPARSIDEGIVYVGPAVAEVRDLLIQPILLDFAADVRVAMLVVEFTHADGQKDRQIINFRQGGTPPVDQEHIRKIALRPGDTWAYDYTIRYIGHDRATDSQVSVQDATDDVLWLDRQT